MVHLLNAFSLSMLPPNASLTSVGIQRVTTAEARNQLSGSFVSAVGHASTATVLGSLLGVEVPVNRVNVVLREGDLAVVAQFMGVRLPEGATELPAGAAVEFFLVRLSVLAEGSPFGQNP